MTDEQFKQLAGLVLAHDEQISVLCTVLSNLIEDALDDERFPERANVLRSNIEQLSAVSRDAEAAREQARKLFGLE
jgi:hypothetical protein